MSYKRRLTADGPRAAYDRLLQSQSNEGTRDSESGIGPTQNPFVVRLDSNCDTDSVGRRCRCQQHSRPGCEWQNPADFDAEERAVTRTQEERCCDSLEAQPVHCKSTEPRPVCDDSLGPQPMPQPMPQPRPQPERRQPLEPQPRPQPEPRQPLDPQSENFPTAYDRLYIENMKRQVKEQRETISVLHKAQTAVLHQVRELPRYCRWEVISKVLTDIVTSTLLGSGADCQFYPLEDELIPKILGQFNIGMEMREEVELFLSEWGKGGKGNIQSRVSDNIPDRRGSILRSLRDEFYTQLGLPRPRKTEPEEVRLKWKGMLLTLKQGNSWRVEHSSDTIDPWGSAAVHHSIARAMYGLRFNKDSPITLNLKQTAFFFHNLELAIDGEVMEPGRMIYHHRKVVEMEERVKTQFMRDMRRIVVTP